MCIKEVLTNCKYPALALECMEHKNFTKTGQTTSTITPTKRTTTTNKGLPNHSICTWIMQKHKNICGEYGIYTYFKKNRKIKNILVLPKDKDPKQLKVASSTGTNAIWWIVLTSRWENLVEHLVRNIKDILEHLCQYKASRPPLTTLLLWKTST